MLAAARDEATLAIGIDADAGGLGDGWRKAARSGLPNALFVLAAAERLPAELVGVADLVTVHFPWGSLLRGIREADPCVIGNLAAVARPGAELRLLLSVAPRDGLPPFDAGDVRRLADPYRSLGLDLLEARPASAREIADTRSSWAKRLQAAERREVTLARFRRC